MHGPLEAPTGGRARCSVADFTDEDVRRAAAWLIAQGWDAKQAGAGMYNGPGCRLTPNPSDPYNSGAFSLDGLARRLDDIAKRDRKR